MNTYQRIANIAAQLREIYNNDNDGPRLIADMIEHEFPASAGYVSREIAAEVEQLDAQVADMRERLSLMREQRDSLKDLVREMTEELKD